MNTYKMFPMFNKEEAVSYIIRRRTLFFPSRKIAGTIAFRYDLDYTYALQLVLHVDEKHGKRITLAQSLVVLLLSGVVLATGITLFTM